MENVPVVDIHDCEGAEAQRHAKVRSSRTKAQCAIGLIIVVAVMSTWRWHSAPTTTMESTAGIAQLDKADPAPRPHIVFMLLDDLGWADTQFGGAGTGDFGFIKTPVMKSLQPESIHLDKHYAYGWCAPSRSSLLSGRLPVHVDVNHSNPMAFVRSDPLSSGEGIPAGMTTIATKLKKANYATHYNGKWGVGFTWRAQNPMSRGFDSFFGYLHDSVDYWSQQLGSESIEVPGGCEKAFRALNKSGLAVDLIRNDKPAKGENGTEWIDYLFLNESLKIIREHDASTPLFLFHAFHAIHAPLNAPAELYEAVKEYSPPPCEGEDAMRTCFKKYGSLKHDDRRSYAAMVHWTDSAIGQVIEALKAKNMWDNTLMVVSADNGGAQYMSDVGYQLWGSGNNHPLRGGKTSEFEGGIRVNSFVTGGLIPAKMRGTKLKNLMHVADWYATFCYLAGVDPKDEVAIENGLPDIDSINQWPVLSGQTTNNQRSDIQVSPVTLIDHGGTWKLLTGPDPGSINTHTSPGYVPFDTRSVGYFTGYPIESDVPGAVIGSWDSICPMVKKKIPAPFNKSIHCSAGLDCRNGCLFNLDTDPNEEHDVSKSHPEILAQMKAKLTKNQKLWTKEEPWGVFNPIRAGDDPRHNGPDKCTGIECTNMSKCDEFVYGTGFYSWAADAADFGSTSVTVGRADVGATQVTAGNIKGCLPGGKVIFSPPGGVPSQRLIASCTVSDEEAGGAGTVEFAGTLGRDVPSGMPMIFIAPSAATVSTAVIL
eukprot:TRINITY_DN18316_c0_g2_i1.p1 TRINITY_DN18316_c0_g2~~TRINITY_DN18316_c0_g2_i1.p1  ORF type:complete len:763 (-),score=112.99 TRINITY_DN18316_c0_g2_i1:608-2896(-)